MEINNFGRLEDERGLGAKIYGMKKGLDTDISKPWHFAH